ncbi:hypothetical protein Tco_0012135 [Tanacetum coccineum]
MEEQDNNASSLLSDFPIAPITVLPGTRRPAAILIRPVEAIPLGRSYLTHPNGPWRAMTTRKRVGPLPTRKLALRRVSPRSSDHHPSSSSSPTGSSPAHSSDLDAPDQAHSGSSTRVVSHRLAYPPRRALRRRDSSKRAGIVERIKSLRLENLKVCAMLDIKRDRVNSLRLYMSLLQEEFRQTLGIGDGDDVRDHVEIDPRDVRDDTEEYEVDTNAGDTVEVGINPMSAPIVEEEIVEPAGEDSSDSSGTRDGIVRSFEDMPIDLDDVVHDFYHHMSEVRIDRIVGIETIHRRLKADQLIARGQRVCMIERKTA